MKLVVGNPYVPLLEAISTWDKARLTALQRELLAIIESTALVVSEFDVLPADLPVVLDPHAET